MHSELQTKYDRLCEHLEALRDENRELRTQVQRVNELEAQQLAYQSVREENQLLQNQVEFLEKENEHKTALKREYECEIDLLRDKIQVLTRFASKVRRFVASPTDTLPFHRLETKLQSLLDAYTRSKSQKPTTPRINDAYLSELKSRVLELKTFVEDALPRFRRGALGRFKEHAEVLGRKLSLVKEEKERQEQNVVLNFSEVLEVSNSNNALRQKLHHLQLDHVRLFNFSADKTAQLQRIIEQLRSSSRTLISDFSQQKTEIVGMARRLLRRPSGQAGQTSDGEKYLRIVHHLSERLDALAARNLHATVEQRLADVSRRIARVGQLRTQTHARLRAKFEFFASRVSGLQTEQIALLESKIGALKVKEALSLQAQEISRLRQLNQANQDVLEDFTAQNKSRKDTVFKTLKELSEALVGEVREQKRAVVQ